MSSLPSQRGGVVDGIDWTRWSVVLLKPDCVDRGLVDSALAHIGEIADVHAVHRVVVEDWQIYVHYWDMLVDRDHFDVDIPACLREMYVGKTVVVAMAHGPSGIPERLRALLGHFDPSRAAAGTIRGDLGADSLEAARAESRLVHNVIHTSDDAQAARRDFGTWYGARQRSVLDLPHVSREIPQQKR